MPSKVQGVREDNLKQLNLQDFSGGLVTDIGHLSLGANQSPDCLNVFSYLGRLLFRGGYTLFSTLPYTADGCQTYIDAGNTLHLLVWGGGNIYDIATGAPVVVASNVYVAGQQVAIAQLNGILYWATLTVPLRQYDGTTERAVTGSVFAGSVPPPACNFLIPYAGSLVAVYPVPSGVKQPSAFMWSNVNDPTSWYGSSIQTVGTNDGSICTFAVLMGIVPGSVSNPGTPATRQLIVGKTNKNIFMYQGALGTLSENAIPCPVGAVDPNSAVYIPSKEGLGLVCFLGSDGQIYGTNGSVAPVISTNIKTLCYNLTQNALLSNSSQKFHGVYNQRYQYYLLDFGGGQQLAYKWDTGAFWLFQGWPSGPYMIAPSSSGLPTVIVCSSQPGMTGAYQIALPQVNDNGANISAYYTTPYLHFSKPQNQKLYDTFTLFTDNVGVEYQVQGFAEPTASNAQASTNPLLFEDPAFGAVAQTGNAAIWGTSLWGSGIWGGGFPSQTQPYTLATMRGRLNVPSTATRWVAAGLPQPFRSGAAQFKISWKGGISDFRVVGMNISAEVRSQGFVGSLPYQTEGNVNTQNNAFTNNGTQT